MQKVWCKNKKKSCKKSHFREVIKNSDTEANLDTHAHDGNPVPIGYIGDFASDLPNNIGRIVDYGKFKKMK